MADRETGLKLRLPPAPMIPIIILLALVLLIFVVLPVVKVFTFPSLDQYLDILTRPRSLRAMRNSLLITVMSTFTASLIGFLFAYAMIHTGMWGKRFLNGIILLPLLSPPFVVALSWILLFGRRGLITGQLLGLSVSLFGWQGLWMVQSIAFFPYAFLIISGVLRSIDAELEYAARNAGANGFRVFRTVTLPLALPGLLNAVVLIAIYVLADFGNPIVIAGGWPVLPTEIFGRISGHYDLAGAAGLSAVLLIPAFVLFMVSRRILGSGSFITVTGREREQERPQLYGPALWALASFCWLIVTVILLVYGTLVVGAFVKIWGIDWRPSLAHWQVLVGVRKSSLYNSVVFSLLAGLGAAIFAVLAAYFIYRQSFWGQRLLDFSSLLPAALPGIFLGVGFLLAFNAPPFMLGGTSAILVLGLMVWNIPLGYQTCTASLEQLGQELEEAAVNMGAGPLKVFRDVIMPLLRTPFSTGFVMGFLRSITNLSIVIFLIAPGKSVATVEILDFIQYAEIGPAVALTVALFGIALLIVGLARLLLGKGFREMSGYGG